MEQFYCAKCKKKLSTIIQQDYGLTRWLVEPCEECARKAKENEDEAYKEGYDDGYDAGRDECD